MEGRRTKRTTKKDAAPRWAKPFLEAMRETGNVTQSCQVAGIGRNTAYSRKAENPEFAKLWDDAMEHACDLLEQEGRRRAYEGLPRKKFDKGQPIIDPTTGEQYIEYEYSDTLLIFMLKAHRPEKYRERYEVKGDVSVKVSIEDLTAADREAEEWERAQQQTTQRNGTH